MAIVQTSSLTKHLGKTVSLRGWVHRIRAGKKFVFIILRDATGTAQCVISSDNKKLYGEASKLLVESSIEVSGSAKKDPRAPTGLEVRVSKLSITHKAERFPITQDLIKAYDAKDAQAIENTLDLRHLFLRGSKLRAVLLVRDEALRASREFFKKNGFVEFSPPMLVGTKGEEGSELFALDYFSDTAYLTQTAQMYLEAAIFSLEKVYCISPTFRAEKSRTRKHLTEFLMLEAEAAWCDNEANMKTQEQMVSHIVRSVLKNCKKELELLGAKIEHLKKIKPPFKRITYEAAIKKLGLKWGEDIGTEDEKRLMGKEEKPVFITQWPKEAKAFYMKVNEKDERVVNCADLQAPFGYGELIGGSQREEDVKIIEKNLIREGDDPKKYSWYLDLRRYGSVPHSGFGLGIARLIAWLCNLSHIRDAVPFPRMINRLRP